MQKAIGFIACVSMMAASLYLFSGGDPSRVLSAQTESTNADGYGSAARRILNDARQLAKQGNVKEARRLAETAASLSADWRPGEQTPQQLLAELDRGTGGKQNLFDAGLNSQWPTPGSGANGNGNPFATNRPVTEVAEETLPENASVAMVNKRKAERLMAEARQALQAGDVAVARARAMQARSMKVTWGLWDEQPDHLLAEIDQADGTETFFADATQGATGSAAEKTYQQASALLVQAREAMDAGKLQTALNLARQADSLHASYGLYEDSPANVIRDLQQLSKTGAAPAMVFQSNDQVAGSRTDAEAKARQLVQQAREALRQNRLSVAREKAVQAQNLNVAFTLMEDRPELILSEISSALDGKSATAAFSNSPPLDMTPGDVPPLRQPSGNGKIVSVSSTQTDNPFVINPVGNDADADAPVPQFPRISGVSQSDEKSNMDPMAQTDALADAANELDVRFMKLRTEVLNSVFRAEKLKETDSDEALAVLARTKETVEAAGLPEESTKVLTSHLGRSEKSINTWIEQRAPIIAMEKRNRDILNDIEGDIENQIRIEQEFADLTTQFNKLMKERRFAEAELVAKKAKDLNPHLPQAIVMVEKSKLHKQIAFNERLREDKAAGFLEMMNDVEIAAIGTAEDFSFGDNWAELSERRGARYGHANARLRTESELKIEKALNESISLHFHNVPLTDIVRHVATTHGINIALDTRAIETEGLMLDQLVSIDVDGISLRSALRLVLDQAGGLVFDIENEVLKITNRLAQDTKFKVEVYPVADLVIPMDLRQHGDALNVNELNGVSGANGLGLYQMDDDLSVSIGGNGMVRSGGRRTAQDGPDFSGLVDLLTSTVEPGSWVLDGGSGTAEGQENTLSLVIRQTPAVHEQIVDLLGQLRRLQDIQVTVEVRFISVTDRFFERIGVDFDFAVQDTLGDPPGTPAFGSRQLQFPGGGQAGGGGQGGGQQGDLRGGQGQQGQQAQQGTTAGLFDPIQRVNAPRDDFGRTVVGLSSPDAFTQDYDIQFRQGSFELGVPDFGNFNPDAGIQVGMAILSDIEAFFFIQAAQADERANLLFAPKVTMFNGQIATITDQTQRPYVAGLIPVVGTGAVGFQPIIGTIPEGINLTVLAVVSADRRFVRLSLAPQFTSLLDLFTFSFASGGAGGGAIGGGQGGGGGGFGGGGGGFGGGGGGGFGGGGFGGIGGGFGGGQGGGGQGGGFGGGGGQQGQQGQAGVGGGTLTVQQPVISQITVSTTVSVPDGGTVLLGGIKRLREGRNMAGVPILNKIPYVSRLFKNSGVGRETESVMMMVTPRIIIQEEEEELILGTSGSGL